MFIELFIFLATFVVGYYVYLQRRIHAMFEERDVKYIPGVPMFGNKLYSTFKKLHLKEELKMVYNAFPEERYVGFIEGTRPVILIRDPALIKMITVKDFDHFINHELLFTEDTSPLFASSLFQMRDDKWRDMRTTLSPAFTGSKMRHMMVFMTETSNNIIEYLKGNMNEELDVADVIRRYTNDVIANIAFGIQIDSLKNKNNDFFKFGQDLFKFSVIQKIFILLFLQFPSLAKVIKINVTSVKMIDFFKQIVNTTVEYREKNKVVRPDMIQLLMEAVKGTLTTGEKEKENDIGFATVEETLKPQSSVREWDQHDILGQVFIFFVAGFEAIASLITICLHELTLSPEAQEKLYLELKNYNQENDKLTYEGVGGLKYLDCVVNETLRKWTAAPVLDRVCTKPYLLPPPHEGGKPYQLNVGDVVYNDINSIHRDPQYYSDPERFDPERFSDENKSKIEPFTFLPFGIGPRACIGTRLALLEVKVLLYHFLLTFKVKKCPKTVDPIKLVPSEFNTAVKGGTYVHLELR